MIRLAELDAALRRFLQRDYGVAEASGEWGPMRSPEAAVTEATAKLDSIRSLQYEVFDGELVGIRAAFANPPHWSWAELEQTWGPGLLRGKGDDDWGGPVAYQFRGGHLEGRGYALVYTKETVRGDDVEIPKIILRK